MTMERARAHATRTYTREERAALTRAADIASRRFDHRMVPIPDSAADAWPDGTPLLSPRLQAWRSRTHIAQLYLDRGEHRRLSVQRCTDQPWHLRYDRAGGITWDKLQAIKAECGFGDCWAIEVYPPTTELVDVAPMRHLWLLDAAPAQAWMPSIGRS